MLISIVLLLLSFLSLTVVSQKIQQHQTRRTHTDATNHHIPSEDSINNDDMRVFWSRILSGMSYPTSSPDCNFTTSMTCNVIEYGMKSCDHITYSANNCLLLNLNFTVKACNQQGIGPAIIRDATVIIGSNRYTLDMSSSLQAGECKQTNILTVMNTCGHKVEGLFELAAFDLNANSCSSTTHYKTVLTTNSNNTSTPTSRPAHPIMSSTKPTTKPTVYRPVIVSLSSKPSFTPSSSSKPSIKPSLKPSIRLASTLPSMKPLARPTFSPTSMTVYITTSKPQTRSTSRPSMTSNTRRSSKPSSHSTTKTPVKGPKRTFAPNQKDIGPLSILPSGRRSISPSGTPTLATQTLFPTDTSLGPQSSAPTQSYHSSPPIITNPPFCTVNYIKSSKPLSLKSIKSIPSSSNKINTSKNGRKSKAFRLLRTYNYNPSKTQKKSSEFIDYNNTYSPSESSKQKKSRKSIDSKSTYSPSKVSKQKKSSKSNDSKNSYNPSKTTKLTKCNYNTLKSKSPKISKSKASTSSNSKSPKIPKSKAGKDSLPPINVLTKAPQSKKITSIGLKSSKRVFPSAVNLSTMNPTLIRSFKSINTKPKSKKGNQSSFGYVKSPSPVFRPDSYSKSYSPTNLRPLKILKIMSENTGVSSPQQLKKLK